MGTETKLLTRAEAARRLRVSIDTIDRLIKRGGLRPARLGRSVRIPAAQIEKIETGRANRTIY